MILEVRSKSIGSDYSKFGHYPKYRHFGHFGHFWRFCTFGKVVLVACHKTCWFLLVYFGMNRRFSGFFPVFFGFFRLFLLFLAILVIFGQNRGFWGQNYRGSLSFLEQILDHRTKHHVNVRGISACARARAEIPLLNDWGSVLWSRILF